MRIDSKWFRERLADMDLSANKFAKLVGADKASISRILNGRQPMPVEIVNEFAARFGETTETVMRYAGLPVSKPSHKMVRVVGIAEKTGRIKVTKGETRTVERPLAANDSTVAIAMPDFYDWYDWVAFYNPSRRVEHDAFGRLSVCELDNETRYMRVLERGDKLKAICGRDAIEGQSVVNASPVIFIKTL